MFCADCGAKMYNHRTGGYEKKDADGNPTGKYTNAQDNYHCPLIALIRLISWIDAHNTMFVLMWSEN